VENYNFCPKHAHPTIRTGLVEGFGYAMGLFQPFWQPVLTLWVLALQSIRVYQYATGSWPFWSRFWRAIEVEAISSEPRSAMYEMFFLTSVVLFINVVPGIATRLDDYFQFG
jgi:hypothetical protein